ncbi:MAG: hypothetical protein IJS65_05325, partial [Clostridia bacterium]|nr:hypothetical protein [Clostridia bacterium]
GEGRIEAANDIWRSYINVGTNTVYVFEDVQCDCYFTCDKSGVIKCHSNSARIYLNDFFAGDGTYVLRENEHGEEVFFIGIFNADTSIVNGEADLSLFLGDNALNYNVEKMLFVDGTYDVYLVSVPDNAWIDEHARPVRLIIDTGSGRLVYDDIMREWERSTSVIELSHKIRRVLNENGVELSSKDIPEKFLSADNLPDIDDEYPYENFKFFLTYDTSDYFSLESDGDNSYITPDMWEDLRYCTAVSFIKDVLRAVKGDGYNGNAADTLLRLYDESGEDRDPSEYINQGDLDHLVFDILSDMLGDKTYVSNAFELSNAQSGSGDIVVCESFEVADDIVIAPGRTLTVPEGVTLTVNGGSLTFKGQTSDGTVYCDTESSAENPGFYSHDVYSLFENRGTVNILSGSVTLEKCSSLDNYGTVDLNGGKLITLDGERRYAGFYKVENGVIETTGPDENGDYKAVFYDSMPDESSYDHSVVGYFNYDDVVSAYVNNQGSINVNHGGIETGGYGYFLNDGFILISESGEFRVKCYVDTNGDIINHGSVLLEDYGIIDQKGFVLNGGTTTLEDESLYAVNVFYDEEGQNSTAATLINDGTITVGSTSVLNISAFKNDEDELKGTLVNYGTTVLNGSLEVFGSFVKESGSVLSLNDGNSVYIDEHGMFMAGVASDEEYDSAVSDTSVNACGIHYALNIAESSSRFEVIYVFENGELSVTNGAVLNAGLIVNEGKISIEDGAAINAGGYIENGGSVTHGAVNVN